MTGTAQVPDIRGREILKWRRKAHPQPARTRAGPARAPPAPESSPHAGRNAGHKPPGRDAGQTRGSKQMLKKSMTALIAIAAGAGAFGSAAHAATHAADKTGITLAATDDTYVSSSRKSTVFGADEKLAVGRLG